MTALVSTGFWPRARRNPSFVLGSVLTALFIGLGVAMGHHGHEEHGHAEHAH